VSFSKKSRLKFSYTNFHIAGYNFSSSTSSPPPPPSWIASSGLSFYFRPFKAAFVGGDEARRVACSYPLITQLYSFLTSKLYNALLVLLAEFQVAVLPEHLSRQRIRTPLQMNLTNDFQ
jgi:hypothetical protein